MLERRKLLVVLGASALAFPLASFAQERKARIPRVGILVLSRSPRLSALIDSLRAGLRELGYVEGRNFSFEILSAEGSYERLPERIEDRSDHERIAFSDDLLARGRPHGRAPSAE